MFLSCRYSHPLPLDAKEVKLSIASRHTSLRFDRLRPEQREHELRHRPAPSRDALEPAASVESARRLSRGASSGSGIVDALAHTDTADHRRISDALRWRQRSSDTFLARLASVDALELFEGVARVDRQLGVVFGNRGSYGDAVDRYFCVVVFFFSHDDMLSVKVAYLWG